MFPHFLGKIKQFLLELKSSPGSTASNSRFILRRMVECPMPGCFQRLESLIWSVLANADGAGDHRSRTQALDPMTRADISVLTGLSTGISAIIGIKGMGTLRTGSLRVHADL